MPRKPATTHSHSQAAQAPIAATVTPKLARPRARRLNIRRICYELLTGDCLVKDVPAAAHRVLARPGMAVVSPYDGDAGLITRCTAELCLVRWADGSPDALPWAAVRLDHVRPDPGAVVPVGLDVDRLQDVLTG